MNDTEKIISMLKELRSDVNALKSTLAKHNQEWISANEAARILGYENPRKLQYMRNSGALTHKTEYYFKGKGFMYLKKRIEEIRDAIINGANYMTVRTTKAA